MWQAQHDANMYAQVVMNATRQSTEQKILGQETHYNQTYIDWATHKNISDDAKEVLENATKTMNDAEESV